MRRIGAVAEAAGMTIRTLRHYDEVGLLVPSGRTAAGYRLYSDADVRRLYRIVALRRLGFALGDIGAVLDREGEDPAPAVRVQIERLDEQIALQRRLRAHLAHLLGALEGADGAAADLFLHAIEGMTMIDRHYTPEQLERLEQRRRALGDEAIERAERDWAELIAEVEAEHARGTDPSDPRAQALADRWQSLIEQFTGGDAGIRASLQRMYETEGAAAASRGAVSPEAMEWVGRVMAQKR